jgi:iron(III) transport system ATP-binding protein
MRSQGGNVASVELKGLSKHYGNAVAVDGVSLRVEHGQLVCLLGPSGCGKTTTLRLIAGFIEPSAGEIVVGGKVLSSPARTVPPEGRNMSMIFQSYALWPHMTVAENVAYGLKIRKLDKATIGGKLQAILSTARLEALADRYPGELSGGQQQRVSLARALVVEPETLLLDEPLSNLDANLREEMRFEIRRLHDRYRYTTVYVTHDQAEAMTTADLIAVMNHGKVEQLGPPEEIYSRPRSEFVARFIGGANILRGSALDEARVSVAGSTLRTTGRTLTAGKPVVLSVRQHEIVLAAGKPQSGTDNHLNAVVTRQVFLGSARDYTVALDDKTELRVTAPPGHNIAPGERVWLHLPAEQCRALAEE